MSVAVGKVLNGKITGITKFGAFVSLETGDSGMVHISEISSGYVTEIKDHISEGQEVKVKVINIDEKGRINLSIKKAMAQPSAVPEVISAEPVKAKRTDSFEDMLNKFKQQSEERMSDSKTGKDARKANYERRSQK